MNVKVSVTSKNSIDFKNEISLISYAFIALSSLLLVILSFVRGNPAIMKVLYIFTLFINLLQISFVLFNQIRRRNGYYNLKSTKIENILLIAWIFLIFVDCITASITFKVFRLDLLLFFLFESLSLCAMYFWFRKIDFKGSVIRDNVKKKSFKEVELNKKIQYIFIMIVLFIFQVGALLSSKIPPKVDDIFSENRVLKYDLVDGNYYVSGAYVGVSGKIVVPKTYNNIPVVGIKSYALTSLGNFESLTLGEYNSDGVLESNLKYIESNSISINKIEELVIPESVIKIDDNAIKCDSIKTIYVYSNCDINLSSFDCDSLETIILESESVNKIDFNNNKTIEIKCNNNNYNILRERNFNNKDQFTTDLENNTIIIDFETQVSNCYSNSWIIELGNGSIFNANNLTNSKNTTSLIIDTKSYNSNKNTLTESLTNPGYVFRGWYSDIEYKNEIEVPTNGSISVGNTTKLYAKWVELKTVKLNWGEYKPLGSSSLEYRFIESDNSLDSVLFPTYSAVNNVLKIDDNTIERIGFESLTWNDTNGNTYRNTKDLGSINGNTINLYANWELVNPTYSYKTVYKDQSTTENTVEYTYDDSTSYKFVASVSHPSKEVALTCNFYKYENDNSDSCTLKSTIVCGNSGQFISNAIQNVLESGKYKFEVVANTQTGESKTVSCDYIIKINKKEISLGEYSVTAPDDITTTYDGTNKELEIVNYRTDIAVKTEYLINGTYSLIGPVNASSNPYVVRYTYSLADEKANNYYLSEESKCQYSSITINPKEVSLSWSVADTEFDDDYSCIYDAKSHSFSPKIIGEVHSGDIEIEYNINKSYINFGTYETEVNNSISNQNYIYSDDTVLSHTWNISKRTIQSYFENDTLEYDSTNKTFKMYFDNLCKEDYSTLESKINIATSTNQLEISFDKTNGKVLFSAIDTGLYVIESLTYSNNNYQFDGIHNKELSISKKIYNGVWNNGLTSYDKTNQTVTYIVNNFPEVDYEKINKNNFVLTSNFDSYELNYENNQLMIVFSAINAGSYNASINSFVTTVGNDNFSFSQNSCSYTLKQKEVILSWDSNPTYNGSSQSIKATVTNSCEGDNVVVLTYSGNEYTNSDNYDAKALSLNNDNYKFDKETVNHSWTINKKEINVTQSANSYTYSGRYNNFDLILDGIVGSDLNSNIISNLTFNSNISISNPSGEVSSNQYIINFKLIDAGQYSISLNNSSLTNYTFTSSVFSATVNKLKLSYSWNYAEPFVYDGQLKTVIVNVNNKCEREDTNNYDSIVLTYSNNEKTNAGSYISTVDSIDNSNYYIDKDEEINRCSWEIEKKTVQISWNSTNTFIYNSVKQSSYANVDNLCSGDSCTLYYTYKKDNESIDSPIDAGTYTITVSGLSNDNYELPNETISNNFNINPKTLTLTWNNNSFTYNGYNQGHSLIVSGFESMNDANNFTISNIEFGSSSTALTRLINNVSNLSITILCQSKNAGSYKTVVNGIKNNSNYYIDSAESSFVIEKLDAEFSWNNLEFEYSNSNCESLATCTNTCLNDSVSFTYSNNINKNAGSYTISITGVNNSNYTIENNANLSATQVITPKTLYVSWPTYYKDTYCGNYINYSAVISGYIVEDNTFDINKINVGGNSVDNSKEEYKITFMSVNAGTYTYSIIGDELNNYNISSSSVSYTIDKKNLEVEWDYTNAFVYDGEEHTVSATPTNLLTNVLTNEVDSVDLVYSNNNKKDASTYVASISINESSNYTCSATLTWLISKRTLSLSWYSQDTTYDGQTHYATLTINNLVSTDELSLSDFSFASIDNGKSLSQYSNNGTTIIGRFEFIDAGTYSCKPQSLNSNYTFESNTYSLTISKLDIECTFSGNGTVTYDGLDHSIIATITNLCTRSDTNTIDSVTAVLDTDSAKNAGTYYPKVVSLSGNQSSNYNVVNYSTKLIINKAKLTASFSGETATTYDSDNHSIVLTFLGLLSSDYISQSELNIVYKVNNVSTSYSLAQQNYTGYSTFTFTFINASSYDIQLSSINSSNYELDSSCVNTSHNLVINKKNISIKANDTTITYGDQITSTTGNGVVVNTFATNDSISSLSGTLGYTLSYSYGDDVGEYTITPKGLTSNNYNITYVCGKLTVNQKVIEGQFNTKNIVQYNGAIQTPNFAFTNLISNDTCNYVLSSGFASAGSHSISVVSIDNENYVLPTSGISTTYTISKREAVLNWNSSSFTYNGDVQYPTATITNIVDGDECSLTYGTISSKNVGSYSITPSGLSNSNYTLPSNSTQNYSILEKEISLSWSNTSLTYNGSAQKPSVSANGLCGNDSISITISGAQTNPGNYTATASESNSNYSISNKTHEFIINKAPISLVWENTSFTYNGSTQTPSYSISGLLNSDSVSITLSGQGKNAGTYTITPTISSDKYYLSGNNSNTYTIIKKNATVTANDFSITYGDSINSRSGSITVSGLVDDTSFDNCYQLSYSYSSPNVGKYVITPSLTITPSNYNVSYVNGELTINQKTLSVTWTNCEFTYDGELHKPTAVLNGIVGSDTCNSYVTGEQKDVGANYVAELTGLSNSNYTYEGNPTTTFTINSKELQILWNSLELEYTGTSIIPTCTLIGVISGDDPELIVSEKDSKESIEVGDYNALVQVNNPNYYISENNKTVAYSIIDSER